MHTRGFTLIELLVVIGVISLLAAFVFIATSGTRMRARDTVRKAEVSQFGRFLTLGCYVPDAGPGDYDLDALASELAIKYPQYASQLTNLPKDPSIGSAGQTYYRYVVTAPHGCALYANLERKDEPVTLQDLTAPSAAGGTGVLQTATEGWNGSTKYFQVSN